VPSSLFRFGDIVVSSDRDLGFLPMEPAAGAPEYVIRADPSAALTPPSTGGGRTSGGELGSQGVGEAGNEVSRDDYGVVTTTSTGAVTQRFFYGPTITIDPATAQLRYRRRRATRQHIDHLVRDIMLPSLAVARSRIVIHATGVALGGKAVGFVGPSGMGKSTMAGACCAAGYELVADDALLFARNGASHVVPTALALRLSASAAAELFSEVSDALGKVSVTVPVAHDAQPLAALVTLRRVSGRCVSIERVPPLEALQLVLSQLFVAYATPMLSRHLFESAADVAENVPMWRLTLSDDLGSIRDAVPLVEGLLR
jgi:hypothetical protein